MRGKHKIAAFYLFCLSALALNALGGGQGEAAAAANPAISLAPMDYPATQDCATTNVEDTVAMQGADPFYEQPADVEPLACEDAQKNRH
jgi:hypothetical protein